MVVFRSTFITATAAFVCALSLFSMAVTASPQFGRPMYQAMDKVTSDGPVTYTYQSGYVQIVTPSTTSVGAAASNSTAISVSTNGVRSLGHTSGGKVALGAAAGFISFILWHT